MKRREFVKICASAVAGVSASPELLAGGNRQMHLYNIASLVDNETKKLVRASNMRVGESYIFHYPFVSTPCFLIDLGRPVEFSDNLLTNDGESYRWKGGVGKNRSIVAFSAICAHKMSHPTPTVSFINYRRQKVRFRNHNEQIEEQSDMIFCCSEKSVYDPAKGGKVLGGPADQPLAAIVLDYNDSDDSLTAIATIGGEMFNKYFDSFEQRLILQYGRTDIREAVNTTTELMLATKYCRNQISCSA